MDKFEDFKGPPTPTRVVLGPEINDVISYNSKETRTPTRDGSLAALTGEVVEAQKYQVTELSNKKAFLAQLQNDLAACRVVQDEAQNELIALNRQLYIIQDDVAQSEKSCTQFRTEIKKSLEEKRNLMSELVGIIWKSEGEDCYRKYENKMKMFENRMELYLQQTELSKELDKLKDVVSEDEIKLSALISKEEETNKECQCLEKEMNDESARLLHIDAELIDLQNEIDRKKEHKVILEKEIDALYKRNAAQMTRLKRQVLESKTRGLRLNDDNKKLEERIKQLRAVAGIS